jgi:hypothetical protein
MGYLEDLWETFKEQPIKILCTSFLIWAILPVIIFGIWGFIQVIFYQDLNFDIFTNLLSNALLPWWASIFMNCKKFIFEYFISFVITLFLVHYTWLKTITFCQLVKFLSSDNKN